MIKITTNAAKNRLYISMIGVVTLEEAQKSKLTIEASVAALKIGFDVINDLLGVMMPLEASLKK